MSASGGGEALPRSGRRGGTPCGVGSEEGSDGGEQGLAMLERAALEIVGSLGAGAALLVPRARLCLAGWIGWRGDRPFDAEPAQLNRRAFSSVFAAFGCPGRGVSGFGRSHREAMQARRVAQLTGRRAGSVTRYDDVAL